MSPSIVVYRGSNEANALYLDGKFAAVGPLDQIAERIAHAVGVEIREGDAFLRNGTEPTPLLADVERWAKETAEAKVKAEQLRTQAAGLLREAGRLDGGVL